MLNANDEPVPGAGIPDRGRACASTKIQDLIEQYQTNPDNVPDLALDSFPSIAQNFAGPQVGESLWREGGDEGHRKASILDDSRRVFHDSRRPPVCGAFGVLRHWKAPPMWCRQESNGTRRESARVDGLKILRHAKPPALGMPLESFGIGRRRRCGVVKSRMGRGRKTKKLQLQKVSVFWSERWDLNPRPLGPEPSAIPDFATLRRENE